jgi:hypothetical protein
LPRWHIAYALDRPTRFSLGLNRPVEGVSWEGAQTFIRKLNALEGGDKYRLPTGAEWAYAARAGGAESFCFGKEAEQLGAHAWYRLNSGGHTHVVAAKLPNRWGRVRYPWECVGVGSDWYGGYPDAAAIDPLGPGDGAILTNALAYPRPGQGVSQG